MYKFLEYETEEDAIVKAEEEGRAIGLPYWIDPVNTTKYPTFPMPTAEGKFVLDVTDYTSLTTAEENLVLSSFNPALR